MPSEPRGRPRHLTLSLVCGGVAVAMVGAAYAAVPFYRAFCQATGFDGTVRRGDGPIGAALDRKLTVRFDTNVRNLPWRFKPEVPSQDIQIGAPSQAAEAMEMGADAVLVNTAIAVARDPNRMAAAFKWAVAAGRTAYESGLAPAQISASATSPLTAFLD